MLLQSVWQTAAPLDPLAPADVTVVVIFLGVFCDPVVVEGTGAGSGVVAVVAFVGLLIRVHHSDVQLQVRGMREPGAALLALVRHLPVMYRLDVAGQVALPCYRSRQREHGLGRHLYSVSDCCTTCCPDSIGPRTDHPPSTDCHY